MEQRRRRTGAPSSSPSKHALAPLRITPDATRPTMHQVCATSSLDFRWGPGAWAVRCGNSRRAFGEVVHSGHRRAERTQRPLGPLTDSLALGCSALHGFECSPAVRRQLLEDVLCCVGRYFGSLQAPEPTDELAAVDEVDAV